MPATDERYPALVERALRLIEERGEPVPPAELCRELFGAPGGPWLGLLGRVLASDGRLRPTDDGRWTSAPPTGAAGARPGPAGWPRAAADPGAAAAASGWRPPEGGAALAAEGPPPPLGRDGGAGESSQPAAEPAVGLVVLGTGPKPWRHPIVAIGAARARPDGTVERWETLVRARSDDGRPIRLPRYLGEYGVALAELEEAPPLAWALDELLAFVGRAPLAGLDVDLAVARLQFALRALGRPPLDNPTVELSVPGEQRPDLARLARLAGLPVPTRLTPAGLAALAARLAGRGDQLVSSGGALAATAWRRLLDARLLARVPGGPGVYRFEAGDGRLLYVGKATSLRQRLASYLTGSFPLVRRMPGLVQATERLAWEELPGELAARLREAELIAAERPTYNVQRQSGLALVYADLALSEQPDPLGRRVPRLTLRADGPLTSATAARAALGRARASWWPPRPSAGARPAAPAVLERFERLAAAARADMGAAEVAPGLRAADLERLLVVAPRRPERADAAPDDPGDPGWSRERRDPSWPPREWLAALGEEWGEPVASGERWLPEEPTGPAATALLVDPAGLRAAVPLDRRPTDEADLRAAALAALDAVPARQPSPPAAGLAALATLLQALRRGEPGVQAFPLRPEVGA